MDRFVIRKPRKGSDQHASETAPIASVSTGEKSQSKVNKQTVFKSHSSDLGEEAPKQPRNCDFEIVKTNILLI